MGGGDEEVVTGEIGEGRGGLVELVLGELQLGTLAGSATDDRLRLGLRRKGLLWAVSCTGTVGWGGEALVGKTGSGNGLWEGFRGYFQGQV